jgi:hypothetical protein
LGRFEEKRKKGVELGGKGRKEGGETGLEGIEAMMNPDLLSEKTRVETSPN